MKTVIVTTSEQLWLNAQATGFYTHSTIDITLESVGFIHATYPDQTMAMLQRHFALRDDLVLLFVDTEKVVPPIKYEAALSGRPGTFPHIYGPLNIDAVYAFEKLRKDSAGTFVIPKKLEELL